MQMTPPLWQKVKRNCDIGKVHLTGIYVGGKALPGQKYFSLDFIDNTFSMEFSSLNYANADNVVYEYRLNGAKEWGQTEAGRNVVSFTHLQPGSYILEVRAYDNGFYTDTEVYHIIIKAPWYRSSWAYLNIYNGISHCHRFAHVDIFPPSSPGTR